MHLHEKPVKIHELHVGTYTTIDPWISWWDPIVNPKRPRPLNTGSLLGTTRRLGTGASPKDGTKALDSRNDSFPRIATGIFSLGGTMGCKRIGREKFLWCKYNVVCVYILYMFEYTHIWNRNVHIYIYIHIYLTFSYECCIYTHVFNYIFFLIYLLVLIVHVLLLKIDTRLILWEIKILIDTKLSDAR